MRLSGERDDTGPGDLTLGFKYRFLDARDGASWPSLGLRPFVKLPVAGTPIGTGRPDVGGILYLLGNDIALDAAAGTSLAGQGPDYLVTAGVSVRLGR